MGDTFGGEHHRPRRDGRGHTQRELQDRASFDNTPATNYSGCLLIAFTILATLAALLGIALT
jgi:hypothetical protein